MPRPVGTLTPAYGRDYKTRNEAEAAFLAGKDFYLNGPGGTTRLCSIADYKPGDQVQIRFKRLESTTLFTIPQRREDPPGA